MRYVTIILGITFTFLILDVGLRYCLWKDIGFVSYRSFSPLAFSLSYIVIIITIMFLFQKKFKIIYISLAIISNIYLLAQMIHFKILDNFFSVVSLFSVGEGADYLGYALKCIDYNMIILLLLSTLSVIIVLIIEKKFSVFKKNNISKKKKIVLIIATVIVVCICRYTALYKLGEAVSQGAWDAGKIPRNIYDNFNNKNRSLMVSGLYEYPIRDTYLYIKQRINPNTKEMIIKNVKTYTKNKGNIVVLMHDSSSKILTYEALTDIIKYLKDEGYTFENFYSIMK